MAQLMITELYTIGGNRYHEWTSWRVYRDAGRTDIFVENLEDEINKLVWDTPLIGSDGVMYNGDNELYASVQIKFNDKIGPWVDMEGCNILNSDGTANDCLGFVYEFPLKFGCNKRKDRR